MVLAIIVTCIRGRISLRRTNAINVVVAIFLDGELYVGCFEVRVNAGEGCRNGDVNFNLGSYVGCAIVFNRAVGRDVRQQYNAIRIFCVSDKLILGKFTRFRENDRSFLLRAYRNGERI